MLLFAVGLAGCDVAIRKTDSVDPVDVGSELTYTITVTSRQVISEIESAPQHQRADLLKKQRQIQQSPGLAETIVTDTLPPGVTAKSIEPSQGTCSQAGN